LAAIRHTTFDYFLCLEDEHMDEQAMMDEIMATIKNLPSEKLADVLGFLKTLTGETDDQWDDDFELLTMRRMGQEK